MRKIEPDGRSRSNWTGIGLLLSRRRRVKETGIGIFFIPSYVGDEHLNLKLFFGKIKNVFTSLKLSFSILINSLTFFLFFSFLWG